MKTAIVIAALLATITSSMAAEPLVLDLWPAQVPGETGNIGEEKVEPPRPNEGPVKRITNVTRPTITVPRPEQPNGTAVLIAPGGGYNILAWDKEGEEVARWLNSLGVTGIVLKYRVPRRPDQPKDQPPVGALQDAQRAMSLIRGKAAEWGLNPKRIGMLGFSAGGHLTAWTATNFHDRAYEPVDEIDRLSSRPDFAVLIYPGGVVKPGADHLSPEIHVTSETPPCFFAHAGDDRVSPENSVLMYLALKRAQVPAELHIYATGGHGFGLRPSDKPCSTWPQRCEAWLTIQGFLPNSN